MFKNCIPLKPIKKLKRPLITLISPDLWRRKNMWWWWWRIWENKLILCLVPLLPFPSFSRKIGSGFFISRFSSTDPRRRIWFYYRSCCERTKVFDFCFTDNLDIQMQRTVQVYRRRRRICFFIIRKYRQHGCVKQNNNGGHYRTEEKRVSPSDPSSPETLN